MKAKKTKQEINGTIRKSSNASSVIDANASAGSLDAFKKLLKAIPYNSGMSYELLQDLSATPETLLPDLLKKITNIPVLKITDDINMEPDHIYIIPSDKMLTSNEYVATREPGNAETIDTAGEESEATFRRLVKNLPAGVYSCDAQGRINFYNEAAVKVWGREPELGKEQWCGSWKMIALDGTPLPAEACPMAIAFKEGRAIMGEEIIVARADGSRSIVQVYPQPIYGPSGKITGAINMVIDVTDQREAARKIRESEENFRQLAELTPEKVSAADNEGNFIFYNQSWQDYTGLTLEEIKKLGFNKIVHPEDNPELNKRWMNSLKTGNAFEMEVRLLHKSGDYKWHLGRTAAVKDDNGNITKWIGTTTEIETQKKQKEELEATVIKRTYELHQANQKLQEKNAELNIMNKELESFAYISSHDLQEPLRKIQTFVSRIVESEYAALTDRGKDYFDRMRGAAFRMQTLIQDLLSYSRTTDANKKFVQKDLNKIVDEVKADLYETIEEKNATIEVDGLCEVNIIPFQFSQMMYNLISNSLKFSIKDNPPLIVIKSNIAKGEQLTNRDLDPDRKYCHISITDNGIGFEPEYKDKIFEVFQRLHTREEYQGTGIGLAIVKKIVANHEGVITATGELNKGATFDIYIPAT
ncbi:MAG TPA: PAS domain S-box protein [Cyclobacteriaceae bacterium]|nr:PAS domain S-box protein [Cyclobacteriaceae bacterium]